MLVLFAAGQNFPITTSVITNSSAEITDFNVGRSDVVDFFLQ